MKRTTILVPLLFLSFTLSLDAAGSSEGERAGGGDLQIVTTTGHLADIVRNVAPEAEVTELLGPGTDPHTYVPSTREVQMLQSADMVFWNGRGLEVQFGETLRRLGDHSVEVVAEIPENELMASGNDDHDDDEGHDDEDDHDNRDDDDDDHGDHEDDEGHGAFDPHVWFDLDLWQMAVDIVADHLAAVDSDNEDYYRDNAGNYKEELAELDRYAAERFSEIPEERRVLVTSHGAFEYLAEQYDLRNVGVFGLSTEDQAGVREIDELADLIVEHDIPTLFPEDTVDEQALSALQEAVEARGHNVSIAETPLYGGSLGEQGDTGTFIGAFRHNVETIASGLLAE